MRMSLILMFLCNIANKLDQTGIIYIQDFWATDLTLHEAMDVLLQKNDSGDTEFWQRSEYHRLGAPKDSISALATMPRIRCLSSAVVWLARFQINRLWVTICAS